MKRYLVTGIARTQWAERKKEVKEGLRKTAFDLIGEGRPIIVGELEREAGAFFFVVECEGPVEKYLADILTIADVEITPIVLCPKDCTGCPETLLVEPLREN